MDFDKSGPTAEKSISRIPIAGWQNQSVFPNLYLKNSSKRPFIWSIYTFLYSVTARST